MKLFLKLTYLAAFAIAVAVAFFGNSSCTSTDEKNVRTPGEFLNHTIEFNTTMRKLWVNHIVWTRNVILCIVDDLPGKDQALNRLMKNQIEIGNIIKPYYGEEAGKKLTELLFEHINIASDVVKEAKIGNTNMLDDVNTHWYKNADEISEFLGKINPNWVLTDIKAMLKKHLEITTDEAVQRIKKDYDADVLAFDKLYNQTLAMADMLALGIEKQFPANSKTIASN